MLGAARTHLRQIAQDLRKKRQGLVVLARELRTTEPTPENAYLFPDGEVLSVEEWVADCADAVAKGLTDLADLAETFARADWHADVSDWLADSCAAGSASGLRR